MPTIHGRKAINFDLNDNLLKKYYPSKSYKNAWKDIKKYFESKNFTHRQYSCYVSNDFISMADVVNVVKKLSDQYIWLSLVAMVFDVTIVGEEYDLLPRIKNESMIFNKNEF